MGGVTPGTKSEAVTPDGALVLAVPELEWVQGYPSKTSTLTRTLLGPRSTEKDSLGHLCAHTVPSTVSMGTHLVLVLPLGGLPTSWWDPD